MESPSGRLIFSYAPMIQSFTAENSDRLKSRTTAGKYKSLRVSAVTMVGDFDTLSILKELANRTSG